ncbi:MAG: SMP-30/gluconolactonase/LRE family protein [Actinomycetota bacterium]
MKKLALVVAFLLAATAAPATASDGDSASRPARSIARPSVLNGPNGVYVNPVDGNVYVASVLGDEITVHDPRTGKILDRIGPERGVNGPDDLVIAPDGTIYWTEILAGNVGMLKPDGEFLVKFVAPGVNPITLSDDGRLFVARDFLGDGLYELDPETLDVERILIPDIVGLNGMDFGPDGYLYGPLFFGGAIVRIDVDAEVPEPEVVATGFPIPAAVAFSPDGVLHAVDFAEGQVIRVDVDTGATEVLADIEGNLDNLAFSPGGALYTTAFGDGQLLRLRNNGTLRQLNRAGLIAPGGVALDDDGDVWVADFFSVREYGFRRRPITSFYDRFDPPGAGQATANTIDVSGDTIITTGWFSNAVQVVDQDTGAILEDIRTLATPVNAIDHGGQLVAAQVGSTVVDARTGDVIVDGLAYPLGLVSDGSTLYVGDWATGQIWAKPADGPATVVADGFVTPEGLALRGDLLFVVEEALDRVVVVDLGTGDRSVVVEDIALGERVVPTAVPHGNFNGIAVDHRRVYVSSDVDNTVYLFKRRALLQGG